MATAGQRIPISCTCGKLRGHLTDVTPSSGLHLRCCCKDCRAAQVHFGQTDPGTDGVPFYLVAPDQIHFDQGQDNLAALSLSEGALLRWYAKCCNAPLFNTTRKPWVFFTSVSVERLDETDFLGPEVAKAFARRPDGKVVQEGAMRMLGYVLRNVLAGQMGGRVKHNPFFEPGTKTPIVTPTFLTSEQRQAAGLRA